MGCRQTLGKLDCELGRFARRHPRRRNELPQRFAFEEFRDYVVNTAGVANVVNRNNVGMIQRGNCARLLFKPA